MATVNLIVVGKYKNQHYEILENDFLKRFSLFSLYIHEVKAHSDFPDKEQEEIEKKLAFLERKYGQMKKVLLSEDGQVLNSIKFANFIQKNLEIDSHMAFIIGGASGHTEVMKKKITHVLSLSPLTFPHKFARLLLIEQLYRAQSIIGNHPYHRE